VGPDVGGSLSDEIGTPVKTRGVRVGAWVRSNLVAATED
jgi:hypothetical protein